MMGLTCVACTTMANQHVECRLPQGLEGGAQVQMFRGVAAPFLGLTAFWTCFRYQGFLVGLFPYESLVAFGGARVPSSSVFLLALVVLAGVALARWPLMSDLLSQHRRSAALVAASGVLGAFVLAYWPGAPLAAHVVASVMVACGLLTCFLMWTGYLATGPTGAGMRKLLLALLAYPCSVACMYVSFTAWGNDATVYLPPFRLLLCVVAWLLSRQPDGSPAVCDHNAHQPVALVDLTDVFLGACATCILGGTIIRGVIDNGISPAMGVRTVVVLLLSAIALSLMALSVPVARRLGMRRIGGVPVRAPDMALPACWEVLAFTFLGGTLLYLSGIAETLGAYVATASCSLQLVLFYILLADKARRLSVSFVPVMLVYGLMFWALCWFASYYGVPWVLARAAGAEEAHFFGSVMVYVATMAVLASGVVVLAMLLLRSGLDPRPSPSVGAGSGRGSLRAQTAGGDSDRRQRLDAVEDRLVHTYGFTSREAQVAVLFASGYSLGRVAEELEITKGTAQGYSRSAYRKAGIHSKDELIDLCQLLGEQQS